MGGKKRAGRLPRSRNQGPRGGGQKSGQSANIFDSLQDDGEMNAHFAERFAGARTDVIDKYPDPERVPLPTTSRTNNDIVEYFQEVTKPMTNAGLWVEKSEIPQPSELLTNPSGFTLGEQVVELDEALRPNKVEGAYQDKQDYLRTHYDLLREDAIRPLREAVREVRRDSMRAEAGYPPSCSIGIYEPVHITSIVFSHRGLAARVAFSLSRVQKYIRWKQSKRLITGSLVALSPADDAFRSICVLATVAARPLSNLEVNPPEIDLFFGRSEDFEIDPMRKWIMIEARSSFFEASRHTLLSLQHMMWEPFPLSEHLVQVKKEVEPPAYVRNNPYTDVSSLVSMEEAEQFQNVDILHEWPSGDTHSLDKSQGRALKRILTNSLGIVQGPPGTGKTHVSVVAIQILLANMRKDDPPIIVTCQTNHALDQLLRHVAEFEPSFIRLGGRSKDQDKIKKRTLFEVRQNYPQPTIPGGPGGRKSRAMTSLRQLIAKMQLLLAPITMGNGCLDCRLLVKLGLMTDTQAKSLELDSDFAMGIPQNTPGIQLEQWLGRLLVPSDRPAQPDDFGMDYEEEDFDEIEQLEELEAEAVAKDDDDIEALRGPVTVLSDNFTARARSSKTDDQIQALLDNTQDLTTIPLADRGGIYRYFQRQMKKHLLAEFRELVKQYDRYVLQRKIGQWEQDQGLLLQQRLIGMTTTGLSKYRPLITSLRPRVVLVEEAAETLEAPITAACVPSLEHLILVGDHQQLRPHCQVHDFEDEPYYFNLSLFERMVINEIEFDSLTRQRRMVPEIRRLLEPIYGKALKDHASVENVNNRPPVEGMGTVNSFFFTHEWLESRDHNMSARNDGEAEMLVGFFNYLVLNGVDPSKITVLTFYNGQRSLIQKKLRFHQNLRGRTFHVVTVDSYQGEENDVVLLSLVRSNKKGGIGFLSVDNRVCVALSRAKRGFYVFGNGEKLATESDTWGSVIKILFGERKKLLPATGPACRIGYQFPLQCTNHGYKTWIGVPDDWELINGGCDTPCRCLLPCGHTCMLKCHPFDKELINCTQQCTKRLPSCGHPCIAICSDPCKCMICDQRSKGVKAMLKPMQKTGNKVFKSKPNTPLFNPFEDYRPPALSNTMDVSGGTEQWATYATGGAKADDAKMLQKRKDKDMEFQNMMVNAEQTATSPLGKLIEISPKKMMSEPMSGNADLLLDLDVDSTPSKNRVRYTEKFTYAAVAKKENEPQLNLLD